MAVPLLAIAFVVSGVVMAQRTTNAKRMITVIFVALTLPAAAWILGTAGESYGLGSVFSSSWLPVDEARNWSFFGRFTSFVHQSWWFSLGWVRYAPPSWWAMIAVSLTAIAAVGTGRQLVDLGTPGALKRMFIALAVIAVALQASALYWIYFRLGNGAQGKSLFPVLVPCLVLLWSGIETWVPTRLRVHAAAALIVLLALLDMAAWTLVALPAYYASF
jgi:hypothetical protein